MKRKFLFIVKTIIGISVCAFGFTACNKHEHNYTTSIVNPTCSTQGYTFYSCDCGESYKDNWTDAQGHNFIAEIVKEEYLKNSAKCMEKAVYFKSCTECGEKSSETFEYGEPLAHNYVKNANEKYLKSPASCTQNAVYYKSCILCGEKGEETFDGGMYEDGAATGHNFTAQIATEEYLKSPASCAIKAVYYKSCAACGMKGDETFEYGEANEHSYTDDVCDICGGHRPTEGLEYSLSKNKDYYIVTGIGTALVTNLVIPAEYNGLPVKEIEDAAFSNCETITSLLINDGVEKIGSFAFGNCKKLSIIELPDSINFLWYSSFNSTQYYKDRSNWDNNVLYIGDYLIVADSSLKDNYQIKTGTHIIATGAFRGTGITSIDIPEGVTHICNEAFSECKKLNEVNLPSSLTDIGDKAFQYCESLITLAYYGDENQWESVKKGWWWDHETANYVLVYKN